MGISKNIIAAGISIFFFVNAMAQQSIADLSKKFEEYQAKTEQSKLHLIFNQTKFVPGDSVWFKAYLLDQNFKKIEGKQLLNVDLVNSNGESQLHFMFAINWGVGYNQFVIPETLSAGIYLISVYSDDFNSTETKILFTKQINIVRNKKILLNGKSAKVGIEGGSLVNNVPNKVSVFTYKSKTPIQLFDFKGQLINQSIADDTGVASFVLIPQQGISYHLQVAGDSTIVHIPAAKDTYNLHVPLVKTNREPLKILATTTKGSRLRYEKIGVIIRSMNSILYNTTFIQGDEENMKLDIPLKGLRAGVLNISFFDTKGEVVATRDFYVPHYNHVNATIEMDKHQFQIREKVKLGVSLSDSLGNPIQGEFTVKVINQTVTDELKNSSLLDEFNINSNFEGDYVIDRSDSNWVESLNNYLIVFPMNVSWKDIMEGTPKVPKVSFTNVITKRGTAFFADTGKPLPVNTRIMFYLQKSKARYQTLTAKDGRFGFAMLEVFGIDELLYFAEKDGEEIREIKIEWKNRPIEFSPSTDSSEGNDIDAYASFSQKIRLISESFSSFNSLKNSGVPLNSGDSEDIEADVVVNVDDYIALGTMEELIKEVIPSLFYRQYGQNKIVRVSLSEPLKIEADPIYIIDGVATKSTTFFLSLKPSDLRLIKVIRNSSKLLPLGLMGKNGIVIVNTKQGNIREPIDPGKLIIGLNDPIDFRVNNYSQKENLNSPNFRSTVYWNPSIKTDAMGNAKIEFYCSDDIGKIMIRVDGLTTKGEPFTVYQEIEVSSKGK